MSNVMNICVTVNSAYMRFLYVMLQSLFENNEKGSIHLFVLQRDFTNDDKKMITSLAEEFNNEVSYIFIDINKLSELPETFRNTRNLTVEILFRFLISESCKECTERVLMLDVDIIINRSIRPLYDTDFEGKLFALVPNMGAPNCEVLQVYRKWYPKERSHWTHYNTGVFLWNLKEIRKRYPDGYLLMRGAERKDIEKPQFEEEYFNSEFGEDIKPLDFVWNYQPRVQHIYWMKNTKLFPIYRTTDELKTKCGILHFVEANPWQAGYKDEGYSIWWDYCKRTPFYKELLESVYWQSEKAYREHEQQLIYLDYLDSGMKNVLIRRLKEQNISRVAIYGANRVGRYLDKALLYSGIRVEAFIDNSYFMQLSYYSYSGAPVYGVDAISKKCEDIDAIVVDEGYAFDAAQKELAGKTRARILSIDSLFGNPQTPMEWMERISSDSRVAIYGAGTKGKEAFQSIFGGDRYKLVAWVDRNYTQIGFPVQSPDVLKNENVDYVLIAIENQMVMEEVKHMLVDSGIYVGKIIHYH